MLAALDKKLDESAPSKLASDFKKIYETEWKSAYHELEKHYKMKDQEITEVLGAIAKVGIHVQTYIYYFDEICYRQFKQTLSNSQVIKQVGWHCY